MDNQGRDTDDIHIPHVGDPPPGYMVDIMDGEAVQTNPDDSTAAISDALNTKKGRPSWLIPFSGIASDLKRRIPYYPSDIYQGIHPQIIASTLYMFFTSIAPALSFGLYFEQRTNGIIGVTEVLFSTSLCGMIFSIISGQPLVIVGVTGPISIFAATVYDLSQKFNIPFLQWFCVISYFSAGMHMMLAIMNASTLVKYCSRFTTETFGVLIGVIYVVEAFQALAGYANFSVDVTIFCVFIIFGVFLVAYFLGGANQWVYLPRWLVKYIADLCVPISIAIFAGISHLPNLNTIPIPFLEVPSTFQPTADRDWIVRYDASMPVWAYFAAIIPALILTALLFFDHNVSSLLSQQKEFNLVKGPAFHWDLFVVGINLIICGIIGIPYTHGLIPQAPLHVLSLSSVKVVDGKQVVFVRENRISAFLQSLLIGVIVLVGQKILQIIPEAALAGLFLYMGVASFEGNQFADRIKLWFMNPKFYSTSPLSTLIKNVPITHIVVFTLVQLVCWGIVYGVTWSPIAIAFPVLILLLVPTRLILMPILFTPQQLHYLDNEVNDPQDEAIEQGNRRGIFMGGRVDKLHQVIVVIKFKVQNMLQSVMRKFRRGESVQE